MSINCFKAITGVVRFCCSACHTALLPTWYKELRSLCVKRQELCSSACSSLSRFIRRSTNDSRPGSAGRGGGGGGVISSKNDRVVGRHAGLVALKCSTS